MSAEEAISWATEGRNTTKRDSIPGGLGLKLLSEFIRLNGGRIQIISDTGYWCQDSSRISTSILTHPFPGTVVDLEIRTNDTNSYMLSSELADSDIF
jgi:hypothetical protein